ncbi:MAG: flagellar type III secretion system protein FlhA [Hydrogenophaga sp.]|uniref:flagellar biosynthesis protein FlhA n=1 Tax=Hydrogenophaga sp. TaxID=1904254 RepID=UPI00169C370A|nr:flagellar biosynthesis protein FlhA [Hydrogenophaga sp.]NIM40429.1 flagellar type III secretion system protein FlhA [Hydrogenophaga sp.]NIN25847.1 flagellar type III secretion system protein FlhA [Hydrogenophaga sp.]NIN30719.1 flagellar type III secretion system protein FlhA [Hydrogenophaga sp.]NIN54812.1 flagellar type III secretion system protein FlhA [Hydrogenophaga sp.]NIO50852.1 flagellar type III secretion system protein FlhA [Hydrogenophaga sp.]
MNPMNSLLNDLKKLRVAAPLLLMALLAMIILPLPPLLLDVLFTFNIVLAMIVLLVAVNVRRPLDFSLFPTVILGATLLRLMLNVASTRVVMLRGHEGTDAAGSVIEAFGHFVIGGNFVVGIVVFVILVIINFVVVTKGAERISEVAARFTLDAMPGKQMAIDADLNAGLINQEGAQARRKEVAGEADFYGAMDGASKFVKGDAIAGILILILNMVGGVLIGALMHDLSLGESFKLYALLTIGDGLAAQIPALLLSAAAAIIVTRVSDAGDIEKQVGQQLLASPNVLYGVAGLLIVLGLVPGMPTLMFLAFAGVLGYVAWRLGQRQAVAPPAAPDALQAALVTEAAPDIDWKSLPVVDPLAVAVGYKLVGLVDPAQGAVLTKRLKGVRQTLSESLGIVLPPIRTRDELGLKPTHYQVLLHGSVVASAEIFPERLMAIPSPQVYGEIDGIPGADPSFQMPVVWIEPAHKAHALGMGYQVVDVPTVIATHVTRLIRENLPELFQHEDVPALLERCAAQAPKLAAALEKAFSPSLLLKVLRTLLQEGVSLKDVVPLATTLLENAETTKDPILLAAEARLTLRRQIVAQACGQVGEVKAFSLGNQLEDLLMRALSQATQTGKAALDNFPIEPNLLTQLQSHLPMAREQMKQMAAAPVLMVLPQLRPVMARYARLFAPGLNVLSYNEMPDSRSVVVVGSIG